MSLIETIQDQGPFYRKLIVELESESNIKNELDATEAQRVHFEKQIKSKKAEIDALSELSKKEFKNVRKLRHLSFRSAAATLSGMKKEKIEKEEAKYQLAFENEQKSRRVLEEIESEYEKVVDKEAQLSAQMAHFEEVKHQYESLIEQVFQQEDCEQFPSEPALRAEIQNYKDQKRLATRDKARFVEAEKCLSNALSEVKKVIQLIDSVLNYVPFEIFGGPIIDEEQVAYLEASKKKIWAIQKLFNVARTALPEIPHPQTLDVVTHNPILQMQLSIYYIDVSWKTKTQQCFTRLAEIHRHTQSAIKWTRQYRDYAIGAVNSLNGALITTKEKLNKERKRIMDVVLSGQVQSNGDSSNSDLPPLFSVTPSIDLPPPVYEAPPPAIDANENQNLLELPSIPSGLSSAASSFIELPQSDANSIASTSSNHNETTNTNDQAYVSHNVNNPFQTHK